MLKTIAHICILPALATLFFPAALYAQCGFESDINLEPQGANGVYCSYDTVTASIAEPFDSYQWLYNFDGSTNNLTPIFGADGPALEIPVGDYGYAFFFVELTRDGCTELSPPAVVDSWVFIPPAVEHEPQSEYCNGDSTLVSNAFGSYASYQWLRDYEPIDGATGPEYWVRESGIYVLNVSPFECPELTLTSGIGPTFAFTGPEVPVITWDGSVLTASSGPNYQWALNGTPIPGATGQIYEPQEDGEYTVTVSDGSDCMPASAPLSIVISGSRQPDWAAQFRVFPNPMGNALNIQAPPGTSFELQLLSVEGKEVLPRTLLSSDGAPVSTARLSKGTYICRLYYKGETASFRLVK